MFRRILLLAALALVIAGCGGGSAAPATTAPQPPAPTAVQAAKSAPPTAPPPTTVPTVAPTKAPPTVAPTAIPTKAPTAAPTDVPAAKVGEPVEANGVRLTVNKVERKAELNQFQKAAAGRAFLVADVTVENVGQPEHAANVLWFKLRDGDGQAYSPTIGGQDAFASAKLGKGEKLRGTVPFDVKADGKDFVLVYDTVPLGATRAQQARVNLGTP